MRAGTLRHYFDIQRPVITRDELGQPISVWQDVGNAWGAIDALTGSKSGTAEGTTQQRTHVISIRWDLGITPDMRLILSEYGRQRTFEIVGVINVDERGKELLLSCKEIIKS